jgi:hypothetical protein
MFEVVRELIGTMNHPFRGYATHWEWARAYAIKHGKQGLIDYISSYAKQPWYKRLFVRLSQSVTWMHRVYYSQQLQEASLPSDIQLDESSFLTNLENLANTYYFLSPTRFRLKRLEKELRIKMKATESSRSARGKQPETSTDNPPHPLRINQLLDQTLQELENYGQSRYELFAPRYKESMTKLTDREQCQQYRKRLAQKAFWTPLPTSPSTMPFPGWLGRHNKNKPSPFYYHTVYYRALKVELEAYQQQDRQKTWANLQEHLDALTHLHHLLCEGLFLKTDSSDKLWIIFTRLAKRLINFAEEESFFKTSTKEEDTLWNYFKQQTEALKNLLPFIERKPRVTFDPSSNHLILEMEKLLLEAMEKYQECQQKRAKLEQTHPVSCDFIDEEDKAQLKMYLCSLDKETQTLKELIEKLAYPLFKEEVSLDDVRKKIKSYYSNLHNKMKVYEFYFEQCRDAKDQEQRKRPYSSEREAQASSSSSPPLQTEEEIPVDLRLEDEHHCNACRILKLDPKKPITWSMIRGNYRELMLANHPDKIAAKIRNLSPEIKKVAEEAATIKAQSILQAYNALKSLKKDIIPKSSERQKALHDLDFCWAREIARMQGVDQTYQKKWNAKNAKMEEWKKEAKERQEKERQEKEKREKEKQELNQAQKEQQEKEIETIETTRSAQADKQSETPLPSLSEKKETLDTSQTGRFTHVNFFPESAAEERYTKEQEKQRENEKQELGEEKEKQEKILENKIQAQRQNSEIENPLLKTKFENKTQLNALQEKQIIIERSQEEERVELK